MVGKVLERLLLNRLYEYIEVEELLNARQFRFRKGSFTTDALKTIKDIADAAGSGKFDSRKICVLVTVDVRNTFKSTSWVDLDRALCLKSIPQYIVGMIRLY